MGIDAGYLRMFYNQTMKAECTIVIEDVKLVIVNRAFFYNFSCFPMSDLANDVVRPVDWSIWHYASSRWSNGSVKQGEHISDTKNILRRVKQ